MNKVCLETLADSMVILNSHGMVGAGGDSLNGNLLTLLCI